MTWPLIITLIAGAFIIPAIVWVAIVKKPLVPKNFVKKLKITGKGRLSKVWMVLGAALVALGIWYLYTNYGSSSYATQALELAKEHWWVLALGALLVMYLLPKTSGTAVRISRFAMWGAAAAFIAAFAYPSFKKEALCSNHAQPAQLYVVYNLEEGCDNYFNVANLPRGFSQDGVGAEFATRPLAELVMNNGGVLNNRLTLTPIPEVMRAEYRHNLPIVFLPPGVNSSADVAHLITGYTETSTTTSGEAVEEKVTPEAAPRDEAEYDL